VFDLGSVQLQSSIVFPDAKLAYKTYGALASDKSNVIVMPSYYSGTHKDVEWLIAEDKILDPSRYFVISVNMFGSGLSSSPSNSIPPIDRGRYPNVTLTDNVRMQHRLVTEVFGVDKIALVFGFSRARSKPTTGAHFSPTWSSGSVSYAAQPAHRRTISFSSRGSRRRLRPIAYGKTIGSRRPRCVV
jgi:hypothetical protein